MIRGGSWFGVAEMIAIDDVEDEIIATTRKRCERPLRRLTLLNDMLQPILDVLYESASVEQWEQ